MTTGAAGSASEPDVAWKLEVLAPWRQRHSWVLDRQIAIAETAAPTGHESERAALLQQQLRSGGCTTVSQDTVGNVIAHIGAGGAHQTGAVQFCAARTGAARTATAPTAAPLVCMAHLDTVFAHDATLRAVRTGARVQCPGIGDNSRGLAAMIALAHTLHHPAVQARLTRPVELVATVGEEGEGNLRGARAYFDAAEQEGRDTYAAIAIDGPGDRAIVHHAVGSCRMRIHLHGHGGHSWANAGTPNPVHAAGALIASLAQLADRERPHAVVTVSRMSGGELLTSIPRDAWIDVDIRAIDQTRVAHLERSILQLAQRIATEESRHKPALALHVRTESLGERPAGHLAASHPLVREAVRATERAGRVPQAASASTDANVPLSRGIPAIAIGAGGTGGDAHSLNEWFDDEGSEVGLVRLIDLVTTIACSPAFV